MSVERTFDFGMSVTAVLRAPPYHVPAPAHLAIAAAIEAIGDVMPSDTVNAAASGGSAGPADAQQSSPLPLTTAEYGTDSSHRGENSAALTGIKLEDLDPFWLAMDGDLLAASLDGRPMGGTFVKATYAVTPPPEGAGPIRLDSSRASGADARRSGSETAAAAAGPATMPPPPPPLLSRAEASQLHATQPGLSQASYVDGRPLGFCVSDPSTQRALILAAEAASRRQARNNGSDRSDRSSEISTSGESSSDEDADLPRRNDPRGSGSGAFGRVRNNSERMLPSREKSNLLSVFVQRAMTAVHDQLGMPPPLTREWIAQQRRLIETGVLDGLNHTLRRAMDAPVGTPAHGRAERLRTALFRHPMLQRCVVDASAVLVALLASAVTPGDLGFEVDAALKGWGELVRPTRAWAPPPEVEPTPASSGGACDGTGAGIGGASGGGGIGGEDRDVDAQLLRARRDEAHEALVEAVQERLQRRAGVASDALNPLQAACDRHGLWHSIARVRAAVVPQHVTLPSPRQRTYVAIPATTEDAFFSEMLGIGQASRWEPDEHPPQISGDAASPEQQPPATGAARAATLAAFADSYVKLMRSLMDLPNASLDPMVFREAADAVPPLIVHAAVRIVSELRLRAFRVLAQQARERHTHVLSSAVPLAETVSPAGASFTNAANVARFESTADMEAILQQRWLLSGRRVHHALQPAQRALIILLTGVDSRRPQRAATEDATARLALGVTATDHVAASLRAIGAARDTEHTVPPPPDASSSAVERRHPRLRGVSVVANGTQRINATGASSPLQASRTAATTLASAPSQANGGGSAAADAPAVGVTGSTITDGVRCPAALRLSWQRGVDSVATVGEVDSAMLTAARRVEKRQMEAAALKRNEFKRPRARLGGRPLGGRSASPTGGGRALGLRARKDSRATSPLPFTATGNTSSRGHDAPSESGRRNSDAAALSTATPEPAVVDSGGSHAPGPGLQTVASVASAAAESTTPRPAPLAGAATSKLTKAVAAIIANNRRLSPSRGRWTGGGGSIVEFDDKHERTRRHLFGANPEVQPRALRQELRQLVHEAAVKGNAVRMAAAAAVEMSTAAVTTALETASAGARTGSARRRRGVADPLAGISIATVADIVVRSIDVTGQRGTMSSTAVAEQQPTTAARVKVPRPPPTSFSLARLELGEIDPGLKFAGPLAPDLDVIVPEWRARGDDPPTPSPRSSTSIARRDAAAGGAGVDKTHTTVVALPHVARLCERGQAGLIHAMLDAQRASIPSRQAQLAGAMVERRHRLIEADRAAPPGLNPLLSVSLRRQPSGADEAAAATAAEAPRTLWYEAGAPMHHLPRVPRSEVPYGTFQLSARSPLVQRHLDRTQQLLHHPQPPTDSVQSMRPHTTRERAASPSGVRRRDLVRWTLQ